MVRLESKVRKAFARNEHGDAIFYDLKRLTTQHGEMEYSENSIKWNCEDDCQAILHHFRETGLSM